MASLCLLALIPNVFGALTSDLRTRQEDIRNVSLNVPDSAPEGRQVVDGGFQSYSIEFSYMLDFAGNTRLVARKL